MSHPKAEMKSLSPLFYAPLNAGNRQNTSKALLCLVSSIVQNVHFAPLQHKARGIDRAEKAAASQTKRKSLGIGAKGSLMAGLLQPSAILLLYPLFPVGFFLLLLLLYVLFV